MPLVNAGHVEVRSGRLDVNGGYSQVAGLTRLNGGTLGSSGTLFIRGGILDGSGTLYGDLFLTGEFNPGNAFGPVTIQGDFIHRGHLNMEIGGLTLGVNCDRVVVTGHATLDGILNLHVSPGYRPNPGEYFEILSYGPRSNRFSNIRGCDLVAERGYNDYGVPSLDILFTDTMAWKPLIVTGLNQIFPENYSSALIGRYSMKVYQNGIELLQPRQYIGIGDTTFYMERFWMEIPEPMTIILMGIGASGLLIQRKKTTP